MSPTPDSEQIKRQYGTDEKLRVRHETHEKYTEPKQDFVAWVLNTVQWRGDERVLDVGCGPGLYYERLMQMHPTVQYVGVDLMRAMLGHHPNTDRTLVATALRLPFPDDTFDVVMANHMLYHLDDVEAGIVEMRRVLKPGGLLMTATNSVQTMPEFQVLLRRAIVLLTRHGAAQIRTPAMPSERYALENGTRFLSRYFYAVVRHDLPSKLVFREVEPAMAYLESTRDLREGALPDDVVWEDVMMIMRQQINQLTKHLGELVIDKQSGVLVASDHGGFVADFIAHQAAADG